MPKKQGIKTAAEYLCVYLHPEDLRSRYVTDMRALYHAEAIVYVLQALSSGMTALFVGLITNYLYDKTKKPDQTLVDLEALVGKQQEKLNELSTLLAKEEYEELKESASRQFEMHQQTLIRIQDEDPAILKMVEDVLHQLEKRGQAALDAEVDSHQ